MNDYGKQEKAELLALVDVREQSVSMVRQLWRQGWGGVGSGLPLKEVRLVTKGNAIKQLREAVAKGVIVPGRDQVLLALRLADEGLRDKLAAACKELEVQCALCAYSLPAGQGRPGRIELIANTLRRRDGDLERTWVQYRLMRAIIGLDPLAEVITDLIEAEVMPDEDKEPTELFRALGEPDMAGGTFGGKTPGNPIDELRRYIRIAAKEDAHVLVFGGPGSGKAAVAWAVHDFGPRRCKPFVRFDCATVRPEELEQELFGLDQKSGEVEAARGGTLFLRNLHCLPEELEPRLVERLARGADGGAGEVRLIAALPAGGSAGEEEVVPAFLHQIGRRKDSLLLKLKVPALSAMQERAPDTVLKIARVLLERHTWSHRYNDDSREMEELSPEIVLALQDHLNKEFGLQLSRFPWAEGNVRQLDDYLRHWVLFGDSDLKKRLAARDDSAADTGVGGGTPFERMLAFVAGLPTEDLPHANSRGKKGEESDDVVPGKHIMGIYCAAAYKHLRRQGLTIQQVAKILKISVPTLTKWIEWDVKEEKGRSGEGSGDPLVPFVGVSAQ